jgi:molybdopterin-binding protein
MTKTREISDILTGVAFTGDVSFGDNDKAIFGAGSDLQIYHDGSNSYIDESGSGSLIVEAVNLYFRKTDGENYIRAIADQEVTLYYNNSAKLATTSTGIEVTGNVVSEVAINTQTGTTYTTVLTDQSKLVTLNNGSAITLTIPANSSVAYPIGTKIDLAQLGAGQVTVAGAGGVTVNATPTLKLRDRYSAATCIKIATDSWLLVGDLAES